MLETVDFSLPSLPKDEYKPLRDELMERLVVLQQQARGARRGAGGAVRRMERRRQGQPHLRPHVPSGCARDQRVCDREPGREGRALLRGRRVRRDGVLSHHAGVLEGARHARGPSRSTIAAGTPRRWQHMLYTEFGSLSIKDGASDKAKRKAVAAAMAEAREERHIDALRRYLNSVADFERQLVDDGYLVVKFFVHVTRGGPEEAPRAAARRPGHALARGQGQAGAHRQLRGGVPALRQPPGGAAISPMRRGTSSTARTSAARTSR